MMVDDRELSRALREFGQTIVIIVDDATRAIREVCRLARETFAPLRSPATEGETRRLLAEMKQRAAEEADRREAARRELTRVRPRPIPARRYAAPAPRLAWCASLRAFS